MGTLLSIVSNDMSKLGWGDKMANESTVATDWDEQGAHKEEGVENTRAEAASIFPRFGLDFVSSEDVSSFRSPPTPDHWKLELTNKGTVRFAVAIAFEYPPGWSSEYKSISLEAT